MINLEKVKENIPTYSSEKLCEMIVCDRYLGFCPEIAVFCMEELSRRRSNGDQFDFETYIEQQFQTLPKLNFSMPDLQSVLSSLSNSIKTEFHKK